MSQVADRFQTSRDIVARWIDAQHLDVLPHTGTRQLITAASVRWFAGEANP